MALLGIALFGIGCWYNYPRIRREIRKRQTNIALTVVFNCLLGALVWGMAIYISSRVFYRFDMTASQRYELAPLSKQVVRHLEQPITIYVCISKPTDLLQEIRDLLDEYTVFSDQLKVVYLDARRSPDEAERLRIRYNLSSDLDDELFVIAGNRYRRIAKSSLYFTTALQLTGDRRLLTPAHFIGEAEITSSLIQLTRELPGRVIFLSGHGERNPEKTSEEGISTWVRELNRQYWQVQHMVVTPGGKPQFPPDTQAVIIAGPRRSLSNEDLHELNQVLNRGGGILFLLDPGIDAGVEPLIQAWNFRMNNDFVLETQRYTADRGQSSLFINQFSQQHPIGKAMGDLAVVLPTARRIAVSTSNTNPSVSTTNFMHTSGYGWATEYDPDKQIQIDPKKDRRGPISVGMAAERYRAVSEPGVDPLQGRIVVIGDSDFVSNRYIDMAGNLDLALNCVEWLAGRHDLLSIRPKVSASQKIILTGREAKFVYWWSILLLPSMVAGAGLLLLIRRRYPS